ncbi:hypothetical protein [Modestobacter marinus]|uniref:hypothetical protein n=1 Tax=Modestobacter marinus TaxID=477641 RepID=UPI001C953793|nr:hypothetical protein [Modestobacter marinus]
MSERDQESAGDYGYDLVHEEVAQRGAGGQPSARHADAPHPSGPPAGAEPGSANDLSYDEAHGF